MAALARFAARGERPGLHFASGTLEEKRASGIAELRLKSKDLQLPQKNHARIPAPRAEVGIHKLIPRVVDESTRWWTMYRNSDELPPPFSYLPEPILVTGASGFIGRHLCLLLVAQGRKVIGVTRTAHSLLAEGVVRRVLDLSDEAAVNRLFEEDAPQTVFHLASHVVGRRGVEEVMPSFQCTLASTIHTLVAAQKHSRGRFILTGSLEEPATVGEPPASPYAASKAAASGYARMFHALYAFPVVIARVFMVYGPDQNDRKKLVPYVIDSLLAGESPQLGVGTRPVDWIHVADVVEGLLALATAPDIEGRTLDLGSGQLDTVREVVAHLDGMIDSAGTPVFDPAVVRPMEQVRKARIAATAIATGWAPRFTLETGLADTIRWHREERDKIAASAPG